jgi:DNA-binding response OmpR family regulator
MIFSGKAPYDFPVHTVPEPTRVFSKSELLRDVWGYRSNARTRTIDSHACRLRHKLRPPAPASTRSTCGGIGDRGARNATGGA